MPMMLAGRGVAGVGAAGLLTVSSACLLANNPINDHDLSRWFESFSPTRPLWTITTGNQRSWLSSIPLGFLRDQRSVARLRPYPSDGCSQSSPYSPFSYARIFLNNRIKSLPCCVVSMALIYLLLRKTTKGPQASRRANATGEPGGKTSPLDKLLRIDWIAAASFVTGGILLLLALNWGSDDVWKSARVIVGFVVGGLLITVCILWEYVLARKQRNPQNLSRLFEADAMIPLSVFTSYDVCATQFAAFASGMVMLVIFYFIAIFMVIVTGLSAVQAGIQLIYFAPGMVGLHPLADCVRHVLTCALGIGGGNVYRHHDDKILTSGMQM